MSRSLLRLFLLVVLAGCAAASTTTGLTPVTGILVRADALVSGVGCGTRPDQIFRYAAVVTQLDPASKQDVTIAGGVFDCFADGAFRQLLPGPDNSLSFDVQIYAFSQPAYAAQNAGGAIDRAAADWGQLQGLRPTYKTKCTATQQENVEVLAVCAPLTGSQATVRAGTASFKTTLGVDFECNGQYSAVAPFYRVGGDFGQLPSVTCPAPVVISPAKAPATYQLDLQLLNGTGKDARVVATAHCRASTVPGAEAVATCDPAE